MKKSFLRFLLILFFIIGIILIVRYGKYKKSLKYTIEKIENEKFFLMMENNKYGVIDRNGDLVIENKYDIIEIPNPEKAVFICKNNYDPETKTYNIEIYDDEHNRILYQYYIVEAIELNVLENNGTYEKSVLRYKSNDKYGLIDLSGKEITDPIYDSIEGFQYREGLLLVKKDGKYGIININGAKIINTKYDEILCDAYYKKENGYDDSGYIVGTKTKKGMRYGYINSDRKQILKCKYSDIYRINDKEDDGNKIYLVAFENGRAGLYENKKKIIDNVYEDIAYNSNLDVLILQRGAKLGVSKFDGTEILPIEYDDIYFIDKSINVIKDGEVTVYDLNGKKDESGYVEKQDVENGKYSIVVTASDKYQIINGDKIIDDDYTYVQYLFNDYFYVSKNNKSGIIDSDGNIKLDIKYNVVQRLNDTRIIRLIDGKGTTIILDDSLEKIAEIQDAEVIFYDDYIKIQSPEKVYYFNKEGKNVDNTEIFKNNKLFTYSENGKWGFKDASGKIIVLAIYDKATEFNEFGYAGVKRDDKWGVIDSDGNVVVKPTYTIKQSRDPSFIGEYYKVNMGYGNSYYTKE